MWISFRNCDDARGSDIYHRRARQPMSIRQMPSYQVIVEREHELGRSGGRGGGALVERGVHPGLDIALEGSRDQAVLFGFMSDLVERGLIGTRNHTVDVELA